MLGKQAAKDVILMVLAAIAGYSLSNQFPLKSELPVAFSSHSPAGAAPQVIPSFDAVTPDSVRQFLASHLLQADSSHCKKWANHMKSVSTVRLPSYLHEIDPMTKPNPWIALLHRWTKVDPAAAIEFCRSANEPALTKNALYFSAYHHPDSLDFTLPYEEQVVMLQALLRQHHEIGLAHYQKSFAEDDSLKDFARASVANLVLTDSAAALRWNDLLKLSAEEEILVSWVEKNPTACLNWILQMKDMDLQSYLINDYAKHNDETAMLCLGSCGRLPRSSIVDSLIVQILLNISDKENAMQAADEIQAQFAENSFLQNRFLTCLLRGLAENDPDAAFSLLCQMAIKKVPEIQLGIKFGQNVKEYKSVNWSENDDDERIIDVSYSFYDVCKKILDSSPERMTDYLERLPKATANIVLEHGLLHEWIIADANEALNYIVKNSKDLAPSVIRGGGMSESLLPEEMEAFVEKLPPGPMRDECVAAQVYSLAIVDWEKAWNQVNAYEGNRTEALKNLADAITPANAKYAPFILQQLPQADAELWKTLESNSGFTTAELLSQISEGATRDAGLVKHLDRLIEEEQDITELIAVAGTMQDASARDQSFESIYRNFRRDLRKFSNPEERSSLLQSMKDAGMRDAELTAWANRMEDDSQ